MLGKHNSGMEHGTKPCISRSKRTEVSAERESTYGRTQFVHFFFVELHRIFAILTLFWCVFSHFSIHTGPSLKWVYLREWRSDPKEGLLF